MLPTLPLVTAADPLPHDIHQAVTDFYHQAHLHTNLAKLGSIEAHLTIVFAAMAVGRWIEERTGWSIKKFVRTLRRYKTIQIKTGPHIVTAADPLPHGIHEAFTDIYR